MRHVQKHLGVTRFHPDGAISLCAAALPVGQGQAGLFSSPCYGIPFENTPQGCPAGGTFTARRAPGLPSSPLPFPGGKPQARAAQTGSLPCGAAPPGQQDAKRFAPIARAGAEPVGRDLGQNPQRIRTRNSSAALGPLSLCSAGSGDFRSPAHRVDSGPRGPPRARPALSNGSSRARPRSPAGTLAGCPLPTVGLLRFAGHVDAVVVQGSRQSLCCIALVHPAAVRSCGHKWLALGSPVCL